MWSSVYQLLISYISTLISNVAELYKELLDSDAVIVTIPDCKRVTSFSSIVAIVVSEDVYIHTLVLLAGLVGSSIVNDEFVNDLFVISIEASHSFLEFRTIRCYTLLS